MLFGDSEGVVTGAASGIGLAIVEHLAPKVGGIFMVDKSKDVYKHAQRLRGNGNARIWAFCLDVTVDWAFEFIWGEDYQYGYFPITWMVNSAGVRGGVPFEEITKEEWDRVMGVNAWGTANACRQFGKYVKAYHRHPSSIVNIGSMTGHIANGKGFTNAHYAASKGAVHGLTKALAVEWAPQIRVNAVCPGPIETPMLNKFKEINPELHKTFTEYAPLGAGQTKDVAEAVEYLLKAEHVTGHCLMVDGGYTAQ